MTKYQNARNLIKQITKSFFFCIDCETIIRERNEWVLNENEFNAKEKFEQFFKD